MTQTPQMSSLVGLVTGCVLKVRFLSSYVVRSRLPLRGQKEGVMWVPLLMGCFIALQKVPGTFGLWKKTGGPPGWPCSGPRS